ARRRASLQAACAPLGCGPAGRAPTAGRRRLRTLTWSPRHGMRYTHALLGRPVIRRCSSAAEQGSHKPRVGGSIPPTATTYPDIDVPAPVVGEHLHVETPWAPMMLQTESFGGGPEPLRLGPLR